MRVFKTLDLIPQRCNLFLAEGLNILHARTAVNASALVKYLFAQTLCCVVCNRLALPGVNGVKQLVRLRIVNYLTVERNYTNP